LKSKRDDVSRLDAQDDFDETQT